jgi:hypothetical protein
MSLCRHPEAYTKDRATLLAVSAPVHTFIFDSPDRALLFVRRVFATCRDVVTLRDGCCVFAIDGHLPRQGDILKKIAQNLSHSSKPPPLPPKRETLTEPDEIVDMDEVEDGTEGGEAEENESEVEENKSEVKGNKK